MLNFQFDRRISVRSIDVARVTVARNLGTWLDSNLNLQEQIHKSCKSGYFHLYNITRIRKYLFHESARTLVHAFIISRIDYCNSLLFGLPSVHLLKLWKTAMIKFIHSYPQFKYMENSCIIIICLHIYRLIIDPHDDLLSVGATAPASQRSVQSGQTANHSSC